MRKPSILTRAQKRLFLVVGILTLFMLANSAYLFVTTPHEANVRLSDQRYQVSTYGMISNQTIAFPLDEYPERDLSKFYQSMLLSHLIAGLSLLCILIVFVGWHLRNAWRRNNQNAVRWGIVLSIGAVCIAVSGLFILTEANSLQNRWIFYSHRILAVLVPILYIIHRSYTARPLQRGQLLQGFGVVAAVWIAFIFVHFSLLPPSENTHTVSSVKSAYADEIDTEVILDPFLEFQPTNLGPPGSIFFPSAVTTTTGGYIEHRVLTKDDVSNPELIHKDLDTYGFVVNDSMGSATCARCHAGIVEQWARSAHRFSSFNNPFYKASIDNLRKEEDGKRRSQWCGACHDPSLMFQGKMLEEIDPNWPEAQAGITCLACHNIDAIHGKEGNGNYNISDKTPSPYLFDNVKHGIRRQMHDFLVKAKPAVHKKMMLKPFFRASEYCLTCHKVSLDVPINHYRWVRGQNEYDNWHDSGVALNASRTFYLPPKKRHCQDCHMPLEAVTKPDVSAKNGMVRSHRFITANTGLPFIRGDEETLKRTEDYLKDAKMSVDVFAIRRDGSDAPVVWPTDGTLTAKPGEVIQIDVVIRNKGVGHTFPGGTLDSNEAWIDLDVRNDAGESLYRSGWIGAEKHVDPDAHFYKVLFVDRHSQPALNRDPQNFHAPVYVRAIGPGTDDVVRYRIRIPEDADGKQLQVSAKLQWRKFNRHYTEFTFENMPLPKIAKFEGQTLPDLPITTVASDTKAIAVGTSPSAPPHHDASEWMRYNDYGIAHFLQQDFRTASWAFQQEAELAPERIDGPRNVARVAIIEGRIKEAYRELANCEIINSGDPQTAWFWGLAKKEDGLYDEAAKAFQRVLAYFPEDRASWRNLGICYYLNGEYDEALQAFIKVLAIDPENRAAHYHRMLIYRAQGKTEEAEKARAAYEKYQIDESSAEFTQTYRLNHPIENRESQKVHVHDLTNNPPKLASGMTE